MMEISYEAADAILRDNLREHITLLKEWNESKVGVELEKHQRENFADNLTAIHHMEWVLRYFGGDL